jgi:hypothetical protein
MQNKDELMNGFRAQNCVGPQHPIFRTNKTTNERRCFSILAYFPF